MRRLVRDIWGCNTNVLAEKVFWIAEYCKVKNVGRLEILPLFYNIDTENFHRRIRITTELPPVEIKARIDEIEEKVNARIKELK